MIIGNAHDDRPGVGGASELGQNESCEISLAAHAIQGFLRCELRWATL